MNSTNRSSPSGYPSTFGFQDLLGFTRTEWREGHARFELPFDARHLNRGGIPHGGVYAALLDTALGSAGCYMGSEHDFRPAVTLNLTVNFLAQPAGRLLVAEGRVCGGGKRVFFAEGDVTDDTGRRLATGSATFRYIG